MANQIRSNKHTYEPIVSGSYAASRTKRAFDIAVATALLVLSVPILIPALAVNTMLSGGHPIFVHRRAGRNGVEFDLLKLRTMRLKNGDECWSHRTDLVDGRLTFFGKILRRTYIDELPQLINVVLGQMSMVGPRPETDLPPIALPLIISDLRPTEALA